MAVPSGFPVQFGSDQQLCLISAFASPAPLGQGGPRSLSPPLLPCNSRSKDLSVCPADFLPGDVPVPVPLPQSGFSGNFLFHLNPFIPDSVKEATSGIWGPSVRQKFPWPALESRRPQFSGAGA